MLWPAFVDKYFSISFGCSVCVHIAGIAGLLVYSDAVPLAGKSGGTQLVYNVNLEGFGPPGTALSAGEIAITPLTPPSLQKVEMKTAALPSLIEPAALQLEKIKPQKKLWKKHSKLQMH